MNDIVIFERNDAALSILPSGEAIALKSAALDVAAPITRVDNAEENEAAVKAQIALNDITRAIETARKKVKEPVLEFGRKIDRTARAFAKELEDELLRVSRLIGDYAALENARSRASEALRNAELSEIEIERQHELAGATSHEERDEINERYDRQAASTQAEAPTRAKGQIVRTDWEIEVTNAHLLAKCHPNCVNITPRLSDIKELLNLGVDVKGIKAEKVTVAGVRATTNKMIEV